MEEQNINNQLYCPFCGSSHLAANKKGFGAGKALTGAVLTGGIGLLAGFIGSGDVKVTCLQCGGKFNPGQLRTTPLSEYDKRGYYSLQRAKEEQRRKEEELMTTGTKVLLWFSAIMFVVFLWLMSKL